MAINTKTESKDLKPKNKTWHIQIIVLSIIVAILAVVVIVLSVFVGKNMIGVCDTGYNVQPRNFDKPSVFDILTPQEFYAVKNFMFTKTNLKLVGLKNGKPNNAYIYLIELLLPPKDRVLQHIDLKYEQPERKARVIVFRGDLDKRVVEEYEVGPLPNPTSCGKINTIPYNFKPMDNSEYEPLFAILRKTSETLYPLLHESYGLCYHNCTPGKNCMTFYDVAPRGTNDDQRRSWFWAFRDIEGLYNHPLGLEIQIDHVQKNSSNWKILQIVYNGQKRSSAKQLLDDYLSGKVEKLKMSIPSYKDSLYSTYKRRGKSEMDTPLQGPKLIEPDGHRYKIHGFHVSYMHWDFNINTNPTTGVRLFDVSFQGKRFAYELALQEAAVFYSGYGPAQSTANYYDSSWLMGAFNNELVPGVDCPGTATFLDVDHYVNTDDVLRVKNSICIFEDHAEIPLRRHYASDFSNSYFYYGGLGDYRLVVRSIANVWNYDYIFDYIFHLSGAVEVKVSATGYVQAAFPLKEELKYGSKLQSFMMADIHQHLFHYKVDLDINGRSNVYSTLDISTETIKLPWYENVNKTHYKFDLNEKRNEDEANYQAKPETRYDIFYNDESEDTFHNKQAYRILNLGKTPFILSESPELNAGRWAKFPFAVSKHKETETQSSSIYSQMGPRNPVVDFEKFVSDNDTLLNEDLVAWVTMGVLHIPHTEDVPSTTITGSQVRFYLLPFNYFPECPSVSSPSAVHIVPEGLTVTNVNTFGTRQDYNCLQKSKGPNDFDGRVYKISEK